MMWTFILGCLTGAALTGIVFLAWAIHEGWLP